MGGDVSKSPAEPALAVIGCGAISNAFHLPALARHRAVLAKVVLVDPAIERARSLASRFGAGEAAADLDHVLDRVQGAIVAVPPRHHRAVAMTCLERGVHVLCEKPLCETADAARELVGAAKAHGVALAVNQTRRLFPSHREVHERIAAGELGELRRVEYVHGEPFDWPAASDSYFGVKGGGKGVLLDTGAHIVDLVCWWLGERPRLAGYRDDSMGGTEAVAEVHLERRDCKARVRLSWLSKLSNTYCVEGTRGSIAGGSYEWSSYTLRMDGGPEKKVRTRRRVSAFTDLSAEMIDNFIEVVRSGATPLVPADEVLPSIETIDDCYDHRTRFEMPWFDAWKRLKHGD
jgi:predicted dehydrogenase